MYDLVSQLKAKSLFKVHSAQRKIEEERAEQAKEFYRLREEQHRKKQQERVHPTGPTHWSQIAVTDILNDKAARESDELLKTYEEAYKNFNDVEAEYAYLCTQEPSSKAHEYANTLGYSQMLKDQREELRSKRSAMLPRVDVSARIVNDLAIQLKMNTIVRSLGLRPLTTDKVIQYKKNRTANHNLIWIEKHINDYTSPIPAEVLGLALKAKIALEGCPLINRDHETLTIKIDELIDTRRDRSYVYNDLDPFLKILLERKGMGNDAHRSGPIISTSIYIAVWGEKEYNNANLYVSPIFDDAPRKIEFPIKGDPYVWRHVANRSKLAHDHFDPEYVYPTEWLDRLKK
jgi:hypothetical protein